MRKLIWLASVLLAGAVLYGIVGEVQASRNSGGTMSLYAPGNPAVANQTITSTLWNNTFNDIAIEITGSLSRNGYGPMLAPMKNVDGTKAAPAFTYNSETASGEYRAGTNDIRMSVNNTDVEKWTATGPTSLLPHTFTGTASEAEIILPHVTAPTTPTNGGIWTTTAGLWARVNGATVQLGNLLIYGGLMYQTTGGSYSSGVSYGVGSSITITGTGIYNATFATTGVTLSATNGTIQVAAAGTYEVKVHGFFKSISSSGSPAVRYNLMKNGSAVATAEFMTGQAGTVRLPVSWTPVVTLVANDTLRIDLDDAGGAAATAVTFAGLTFSVMKIG